MPEMLSVALHVVWDFACPRTLKQTKPELSLYYYIALGGLWWCQMQLEKRFFCPIKNRGSVASLPLQVGADDRGCTLLIVITHLFFLSCFCLPSSFLHPFHPASNKMELKTDFLSELWYQEPNTLLSKYQSGCIVHFSPNSSLFQSHTLIWNVRQNMEQY